MLDRTSSSDDLNANEIAFLLTIVNRSNLSTILKFLYYSDENEIAESMDLFSSLKVIQRMEAINFIKYLKSSTTIPVLVEVH